MSQSQLDLNRLIDELTGATRNRRAVTATYRGQARRLCPHVLGKKGGRWECLFYQAAGGGDSGPSGNWRCIPLEDLTDLEVVGGRWHSAPEGSRPPGCVDEVRAQAPARRPARTAAGPAAADVGRHLSSSTSAARADRGLRDRV
jgi:hypothetical protein